MIGTILLTLAAAYTGWHLSGGNVTVALLVWVATGLVLAVLDSKIMGGK